MNDITKILKIDHQSPVPLHAQVEQLMRQLAQMPEYKKGAFFPKEVDLAKRLGISRNTVRQAINKLVLEGLLVRKKGVGTTIAPRQVKTQLTHWVSFTREMEKRGLTVHNHQLSVTKVIAPELVAAALQIKADTEVLKLERLRGIDGTPGMLTISWFHPSIGLTGAENFTRPIYEMLDENFSVVAALSREEIQAINADPVLASQLKLPPEAPVLFRTRTVFDPGNRPIEFNQTWYRGDSFTYSIDIKRNHE